MRHREIHVAGIPGRAIRLGFVGELSYELHHPSSQSVELWDALIAAGSDLGVLPAWTRDAPAAAPRKGHIIIGQDTDYDSTPAKIGMEWAVKHDNPTSSAVRPWPESRRTRCGDACSRSVSRAPAG